MKTKDDMTNVLVVYSGMTSTGNILTKLFETLNDMCYSNVCCDEASLVTRKELIWADVVLLVRGADTYMKRIAKASHDAGRCVILYLDDDLLSLLDEQSKYYKALRYCVDTCDVFWSSNPHILDLYMPMAKRARGVEAVAIEPWNMSDITIRKNKEESKIGILFAGSASHIPLLQKSVFPALRIIQQNNNNLSFYFVGCKENDLVGILSNVVTRDWFVNSDEYRKYVNSIDVHIGLAYVENTRFGKCKFYNKFLEYTKLGIVGVYSDCDPYRSIVCHGKNGFLAQNTIDGWVDAINLAISNQDLREKCLHEAQDILRTQFSTETVINLLCDKIPEVVQFKSCKNPVKYRKQNAWIDLIRNWIRIKRN